jgi:hypothetical protein
MQSRNLTAQPAGNHAPLRFRNRLNVAERQRYDCYEWSVRKTISRARQEQSQTIGQLKAPSKGEANVRFR